MSANYQKFLEVLKKWPAYPKRINRDYGCHLRILLKNPNIHKEIFPGDAAENEEKINALMRLADDFYLKKYPYKKKIASLNLEVEYLEKALDEFIEEVKRKKEPDSD